MECLRLRAAGEMIGMNATTVYFDDPAQARKACDELTSLGIPESCVDLELHQEGANFIGRVKEFFGVEAPEDVAGAIMTIHDVDESQQSLIAGTLTRYNAQTSAPDTTVQPAIKEETNIPTLRSSTGVPIKPVSEHAP